ncbi:MAG: cation diffusion facilitator family transporter [Ruminobacter sp.]|nr:cation diffusion facilitator family transporter [Ruminobacter sp.]
MISKNCQVNEYARLVKIAGWLSITTATILILSKIVALLMTQSSTLLASLTDSFLDVFAAVINLIAINYSLHPADEQHRYGHGKIESIASLSQAVLIGGSSFFLIIHGITRVYSPITIENIDVGIEITILSMVLTVVLISIQSFVIKKTKSQVIIADRLHYLSDVIFNIGVLISLYISSCGFLYFDGLFSIILGLYILKSSYMLLVSSLRVLIDTQIDESDVFKILDIIQSEEEVKGVHDLRTRRAGSSIFIQAHIELDKNMSLDKAHSIADNIEHAIIHVYPNADVTLHMEPI